MRIVWIAESETMTECPSSAEVALPTPTPRPWSSWTQAPAARPSAVAAPSSSSTISARRLMRFVLRVIIVGSPVSLGKRAHAEEREGVEGGLAAPPRVELLDLARAVEAAEAAVDQQAEVLVAS